jgi:hypothetical protein
MWTEVCAEAGIKNAYLEHRLKYNAKLKDSIIELAIHRRLNQRQYRLYGSVVEGLRNALLDVLKIVKSKYIHESKTKKSEEMDQEASRYIKCELRRYVSYTRSQGIVIDMHVEWKDYSSKKLKNISMTL